MPPRKLHASWLPESAAASILPRSCIFVLPQVAVHAAERPDSMNIATGAQRWILPVLALGIAGLASHGFAAPVSPDQVVLAPHRAVYDLKLSKSQGSRGIEAVRGRILYDFSGNACEGYA